MLSAAAQAAPTDSPPIRIVNPASMRVSGLGTLQRRFLVIVDLTCGFRGVRDGYRSRLSYQLPNCTLTAWLFRS